VALHHRRDPALLERDLVRIREGRLRHLFPRLERTPDLNRGEMRLAAEVALAEMAADAVPAAALQRAVETLTVLAKG
jgi:hypothetical protein